jgi:hypothetical protein
MSALPNDLPGEVRVPDGEDEAGEDDGEIAAKAIPGCGGVLFT